MWPEYVKQILKCGTAEKAIQIQKENQKPLLKNRRDDELVKRKKLNKKLSTKHYTKKNFEKDWTTQWPGKVKVIWSWAINVTRHISFVINPIISLKRGKRDGIITTIHGTYYWSISIRFHCRSAGILIVRQRGSRKVFHIYLRRQMLNDTVLI